MTTIFLIAAFNALFFTFLLFQKKPKGVHDRVLIMWLLYLGHYTGTYALLFDRLYDQYPLWTGSFISLLTLHGPFLFLYLSSLTRISHKIRRIDFLHFLPFLLFNVFLLIATFFPEYSARIRMDYIDTHIHPPFLFLMFLSITALSGPVYFAYAFRLLKNLDITIYNNFSYSESINLEWLRKLVFIFGTVWTILIVITSLHHVFHLFSMHFCMNGLFLSLAIFIILVGYFGLKQEEIFRTHSPEKFITEPKEKKYAGSALTEAQEKQIAEKLTSYINREKPYLNPDLNLPRLADELEMKSHHLSQVINDKLEANFFEYINRYRVEEVKTKMTNPDYSNYSLLGIAFESGFNSKSAFNRVFKNITGNTPTQYKKAYLG
ncbi:MAG: helix-turn-helix domain-containing protein [Bacteroidales bacterium]|nr:helix-turn-helix domain-containing protein [Bacteroidales bacterium]MCF8334916.1 helix-turn-helix domain-containing protein [Bacteroidales bacterium]